MSTPWERNTIQDKNEGNAGTEFTSIIAACRTLRQEELKVRLAWTSQEPISKSQSK